MHTQILQTDKNEKVSQNKTNNKSLLWRTPQWLKKNFAENKDEHKIGKSKSNEIWEMNDSSYKEKKRIFNT